MGPFLTVKLKHTVRMASGEQCFSKVKQLKYYFTHLHVVGDTVQTCSAVKDAAFRLKFKDCLDGWLDGFAARRVRNGVV